MSKFDSFFEKMYRKLHQHYFLHAEASAYFRKLNYLVTLPAILMVGTSSALSFISTSPLIPTEAKSSIEVIVGIITSVSTIMQTVSSVVQYGSKAESHKIASESYNNLITKLEFEKDVPNEDPQAFANTLEAEITSIKTKCNFYIPQQVMETYRQQMERELETTDGTADNSGAAEELNEGA